LLSEKASEILTFEAKRVRKSGVNMLIREL
jgi:predicted nucleic acid-binding Zn ribbon protein